MRAAASTHGDPAGRTSGWSIELARYDGIGLPADRERLTEPYMTTRAYAAPGLGLAIVKKIVEEHAGTIAFALTAPAAARWCGILLRHRQARSPRWRRGRAWSRMTEARPSPNSLRMRNGV